MWDGIILEIDPTVAAVSTLLIVLSGLLLATSQLVKRAAARRGGVRE
jgi:ABC-type spermidine/putrescine transport system permease subunit II